MKSREWGQNHGMVGLVTVSWFSVRLARGLYCWVLAWTPDVYQRSREYSTTATSTATLSLLRMEDTSSTLISLL